MLEWELPHLSAEDREKTFPLLKPLAEGTKAVDIDHYMREDMVIVGTPEECVEKCVRYAEAGVDQLLCYVQFGKLPHEKVMRNLELLGTKVIPAMEQRGHRVTTTVAVNGDAVASDGRVLALD